MMPPPSVLCMLLTRGWRMCTYRPEGNDQAHILWIGIWLDRSRYITIRGVEISNPQYLGGGGMVTPSRSVRTTC